MPQMWMTKKNIVAKILGVLPIIAFGIMSIIQVWTLNGDYKVAHWIIGISLTCTIFATYTSSVSAMLSVDMDM